MPNPKISHQVRKGTQANSGYRATDTTTKTAWYGPIAASLACVQKQTVTIAAQTLELHVNLSRLRVRVASVNLLGADKFRSPERWCLMPFEKLVVPRTYIHI